MNCDIVITDANDATCTQAVTITIEPGGFDCGTVPTNIQDAIWTRVDAPIPTCKDGHIIAGICSDWFFFTQSTNPVAPCFFGTVGMQWRAPFCNPGIAYNVTVRVFYTSSGGASGPAGIHLRFGLLTTGTFVDANGNYITDTPNPLVTTLTIPANTSDTLYIVLDQNGSPSPTLSCNPTANMTITPLTHP
jgi:hypothetical protein